MLQPWGCFTFTPSNNSTSFPRVSSIKRRIHPLASQNIPLHTGADKKGILSTSAVKSVSSSSKYFEFLKGRNGIKAEGEGSY